jgi:hypothetical protein
MKGKTSVFLETQIPPAQILVSNNYSETGLIPIQLIIAKYM